MHKISIITVCYNEKYIESTCESIISQTFQDFEWLVIDGCSTDGTLNILEKYKDRIDIFVSEQDTGIYNAMNKGIQRASGEYLLFLNGGDYLYQADVLEKIRPYLDLGKDIVYGDVVLSTDPIIKENYPPRGESNILYFIQGHICHQAMFIRAELFKKFGLYDERYTILADWEKWIVFAKHGASFYYIQEIISFWRPDGLSQLDKFKTYFRDERNFILDKHYTDEELILHGHIPTRGFKQFRYKIKSLIARFFHRVLQRKLRS